MKGDFSIKTRHLFLLFILVTALSIFIRFWNYEKLLNFHGDPPFFLMEVKDMLESGKLRLIGPIVKSQIIEGRGFFTGPFLYYFLALLGMMTNWNVYVMTGIFSSLWIFAFIAAFIWLKNRFDELTALFVYVLLSFFPFFLPQSRSIWNPHFIPLFGIMSFGFLDKRKESIFYYLLSGLFFGLALNIHFSAVLWIPAYAFIVFYEIVKRKFIFRPWILFFLGVIAGELPYIIFELRHNFYNISTLIFQLQSGGLFESSRFGSGYYYLYPLVPYATFFLGYVFNKLLTRKRRLLVTALVILVSIYFLILSLGSPGQTPIYPQGLGMSEQKKIVNLIVQDNEKKFEVAETISADTQATEIRWWLREAGIKVMEVSEYDKAPILYLIAPESRPPKDEDVWEVRALRPIRVEFKNDLGNKIFLYKLIREEKGSK